MFEILSKIEVQNKRKRIEGGSIQDRKDKGFVMKVSKEKYIDGFIKIFVVKKLIVKDRIS